MEPMPFIPNPPQIQRARLVLQRFVPAELAYLILHLAEYYCTLVSKEIGDPTIETRGINVVRDRGIRNAITIRNGGKLCLTIGPFTKKEAQSVIWLSVTIKGHDQGWSSYPEDQGTKRGSWTWYTMTFDEDTLAATPERLATNIHAEFATQTHAFAWGRDSEMVKPIQAGQPIKLWAHAR
ncbi:hypothetical protein EW026_g5793 [Hermanssonia centrifuga]|uniref:Uncharacterized protein n=1 Tax=Hermanssonia centrifuga TaxID=98765 RepID=A0A4S4KEP7_9APHY|nr:hypothetical protein EW026_g5793 [Hermanssonia centrifuga]